MRFSVVLTMVKQLAGGLGAGGGGVGGGPGGSGEGGGGEGGGGESAGSVLNQGILRLNHEHVPALYEMPVEFAPTYMRTSQGKSPAERGPSKRTSHISPFTLVQRSSGRYGNKRCPAWTDRVLMDSCAWEAVRSPRATPRPAASPAPAAALALRTRAS